LAYPPTLGFGIFHPYPNGVASVVKDRRNPVGVEFTLCLTQGSALGRNPGLVDGTPLGYK
jgi:hypothetical protein